MTPQLHGADCPGPHTQVIVGGAVGVRCEASGATFWFRRCAHSTESGKRCPEVCVEGRSHCARHG